MQHIDAYFAEEGKAAFRALAAKGLGVNGPAMRKPETCVKFIDPFFRNALGSRESTIHRAASVTSDFADHILGSEFRWSDAAAKRAVSRFKRHGPSRKRRLKLSSASLLENPHSKPLIQQTDGCSYVLGNEFTIIANGSQFILLHSIPKGCRLAEGKSFIWHYRQDLLNTFHEFGGLLSGEAFGCGTLSERITATASKRQLVACLIASEREEMLIAEKQSGPYASHLSDRIQAQLDEETGQTKNKTSASKKLVSVCFCHSVWEDALM